MNNTEEFQGADWCFQIYQWDKDLDQDKIPKER